MRASARCIVRRALPIAALRVAFARVRLTQGAAWFAHATLGITPMVPVAVTAARTIFPLPEVSRHLLHVADAMPELVSRRGGVGTCCAVAWRRKK